MRFTYHVYGTGFELLHSNSYMTDTGTCSKVVAQQIPGSVENKYNQ